jgi:hypothetical protein
VDRIAQLAPQVHAKRRSLLGPYADPIEAADRAGLKLLGRRCSGLVFAAAARVAAFLGRSGRIVLGRGAASARADRQCCERGSRVDAITQLAPQAPENGTLLASVHRCIQASRMPTMTG